MNRLRHYEWAFEDLLRSRGVPYVSVDETKKTCFAGVRIKSFDFLIYPSHGPNLLADVKGRKFPARSAPSSHRWESWVGMEDVEGLLQWEGVFGEGFQGVFVFAYLLPEEQAGEEFRTVHRFEEGTYAFLALPVGVYRSYMKPRSPKWRTVYVPAAPFRQHVRPFDELL